MKCLIFCIAFLLLAMTSLAGARGDSLDLREVFQCKPCSSVLCPQVEPGCELVPDTGICSCCKVCARQLGDFCGLKTGRCGRGLRCRPAESDPNPIYSLLIGRGRCQLLKLSFRRKSSPF